MPQAKGSQSDFLNLWQQVGEAAAREWRGSGLSKCLLEGSSYTSFPPGAFIPSDIVGHHMLERKMPLVCL